MTKALHDLQNARIVSRDKNGPLDTAIYHCQQAAEKSLKAWLVWTNVEFNKTHDVARLVLQAAETEPGFTELSEAAQLLNPYVSAFRYPGMTDELMPTREQFDETLQHAQTIYDFVLNLLPKEAQPIKIQP